MFLAKEKKRRLLQEKHSVTVQKYLRRFLAKKCYFRLLSDAYDQMKLRKVQLIQHHARAYLKRVRQAREVRAKKATLIQAVLRGRAARREVAAKRHFLRCILLLQCFYRARHRHRATQALTVQKYLRGLVAFRKYSRLAQVRQATTGILE